MSSENFKRWAAAKARNADGLKPSLPLAARRAIVSELESRAAELGACRVQLSRTSLCAQRVARAGLLFELAGMKCEQIAVAMGVTNGTVSRWVRAHRRLIQEEGDYARISAQVATFALRNTHRRP